MSITILLTIIVGSLLPSAGHVVELAGEHFAVLTFSGATPVDHLMLLRSESHVVIPDALGGMINFPSFHAAVAVFVPWTLRHFRALFPAVATMNAMMFVSSITEGGHYACDAFGGVAIAAAAFRIAAKLSDNKFAMIGERPNNAEFSRS